MTHTRRRGTVAGRIVVRQYASTAIPAPIGRAGNGQWQAERESDPRRAVLETVLRTSARPKAEASVLRQRRVLLMREAMGDVSHGEERASRGNDDVDIPSDAIHVGRAMNHEM